MATEVLRPNGNNNAIWNQNDYTRINDAVLTGNAGDGVHVVGNRNDDNEEQSWTMEDTSLDNISQIVLHFRSKVDDVAVDMQMRLSVGDDGFTAYQSEDVSTLSWLWFSKTYTPTGGNWTTAQVNDLDVSFLTEASMASSEEFHMDVMYVVVTGDEAATVPDAPTGLTATTVSSSAIDLSWTAPVDDGGASITGYKIEQKIGAGGWATLVADTGTTDVTYNDTGLTASTLYTYRVSAINSVGTGVASGEASDTTSAEPVAGTSDNSLKVKTIFLGNPF